MKKLIYALTLALACGGFANAITPKSNLEGRTVPKHPTGTAMKAVKINNDGTRVSNRMRAKQKLTAQDFFGYWQWSGNNLLGSVIMPNEGVMNISQLEGTDSILVQGFDVMADTYGKHHGLVGYFKDNRIYIPNQISRDKGLTYEDEEGKIQEMDPAKFVCWTIRNFTEEEKEEFYKDPEHAGEDVNDYGKVAMAPKGYDFFFALNEAGDLTSIQYLTDGPYTDAEYAESFTIASEMLWSEEGYWWLCSKIRGYHIELFEFNPAEWQSIGNATFTDAWMRYSLENNEENFEKVSIPYEVPAYRSTLNPNRFLLAEPYGPNTIWGVNNINADLTMEGYIVFDITNPECVLFEPYVYSLTLDMGRDDESYLNQIYCYNSEAYSFFIEGLDYNRIINSFDIKGYTLSEFIPAERTVAIYNPCFDAVPEYGLATPINFDSKTRPSEQNGKIVLPEGYNAVENILGEDNGDTPAVYFNLQGARVNNPEKGQLLIVKKGNKASKVIF